MEGTGTALPIAPGAGAGASIRS
ncbi:uncharacterized protein METZ01_LOCUS367384, partial [marine metagenome]